VPVDFWRILGDGPKSYSRGEVLPGETNTGECEGVIASNAVATLVREECAGNPKNKGHEK